MDFINLGCIIRKRNLLAHVSIWTIVAIVLIISLTVFKGNLFGIIYLVFFLICVLIFQASYRIWARTIKTYSIALILYSTSVSLLTYTFQYSGVNSLYLDILPEQVLNDIGLVVRASGWMIFVEPFVPLSLVILLVIYLRVFQDDFHRFAYLAEEDDQSLSTPLTGSQLVGHQTINDSTFILLNTTNMGTSINNTNNGSTSTTNHDAASHSSPQLSRKTSIVNQSSNTISLSRVDLRKNSTRACIENFFRALTECTWRILEVHFIKLVALMIFRLPMIDICLMNLPLILVVIVALKYPSATKCSCLTASSLISFVIIVRNVANLSTLKTLDITNTCPAAAPTPLAQNSYSYLNYFGINHDSASQQNRVDNHILVLLLITVNSFITIHYEKREVKDYELSFGVIFSGIGRREADAGIINCLKYFCNFGFYKFGIEITCLVLIIAISNRLDLVAAIYGLILIVVSITTSRNTLASIWPFLNILLCLLIPVQYLLRLGLPPALCSGYPWDSFEEDIKYWLYLSDYANPQDAHLLLYDFLVLLVICRQTHVFKHMRLTASFPYVNNDHFHHNLSAQQFKLKYLPSEDEMPAEDCFSNYTTPTNYLKSIFFISIYWFTLAAVLIAGATKTSLFSLGYLIGCFIFLWLGNDTYLMPIRRLIFSWNLFVFYAALVIFAKVIIQLFTCYLNEYLLNHCYILQLLRVVCYRKRSGQAALCSATNFYDELDILWDGLCLMFLLMQRIVFGSRYFRYLVKEVKAQQILASRGAELIMATQIEEAKAQALYEKEVMISVREKMENLKMDNDTTSKFWQRLLSLPHHHQIIRNADKHLFSVSLDEPVSQCGRTDNWKFKKAFIPDPLGDELERMSEINGISAVFTRWMKGKPLYGSSQQQSPTRQNSHSGPGSPSSPRNEGDQQEATPHLVQPHISQQEQQPAATSAAEQTEQGQADPASFDIVSEEDTSEVSRIRSWWETLNLIVYSCLLSATVELNKLSRSYRYVSRRMAVEKNTLKKQFNLNDERFKSDPQWRKWVISTLSETYTKTNQQYQENQSNTSLHRIRSALRVLTSSAQGGQGHSSQDSGQSGDSDKSPPPGTSGSQRQPKSNEITDPEYHFLKLNIFTQFCRALAYVFISNTSLWCQLVIILNQVINASLLSLPLPLLTFLWGTLSVPRPTKRFWKIVITYTELIIVVKYVCQFPLWNWENNVNPFYYPNLLGIMNITIFYDLFLLLALFFHRSMLKSLGQWGSSGNQHHDQGHAALLESEQQSPSHYGSGGETPNVAFHAQTNQTQLIDTTNAKDSRLIQSCDIQDTIIHSVDLQPRLVSSSYNMQREELDVYGAETSYQNQQAIGYDTNEDQQRRSGRCSCLARAYNRAHRSISMFFQHVLNTPYKVQTDVYVWMFLCDFINFLILIYGFWAFGSGYTNQTVASFLNENRIPFSVLIMLLAQFASIIIDRAFYLQKNLGGKLMFQVILVIGIHLWIFFLLPFTTGHSLTMKDYWPPKAWYVFKCIYFLLSAHQIRCGYPRRVLGNCFTKGFGYANWGAFKVYRAIPLVYDLRLYMDWIWTETTLEFRNWSIMEDMFAGLFIRKCELTLEEEYPTPRAKPIRHVSKYLTGGAFILLILAIIWGPLLLFSMGKTVGESNPPVEMEYELEFVGFQPILKLRATTQQIIILNGTQYDQLKLNFNSLASQSFFSDYKVGDVSAIRLDGQSNAVWEISPPSKELLMSHIKNNETLTLKSSWTIFRIKREKSQSFDGNIAGSYQKIISGNSSQEFRNSLYDMLANSSTTQTETSETKYVITPPIFPNYIRAPETGQVSLVDQFHDPLNQYEFNSLRPLNLSYIRVFDLNINQIDNSTSWWKADDLCKYSPQNDSYPFWPANSLSHCESLVMVAFNDRIFTGILALLSAPGIIGLYTTFVVFFARLIRTEPSAKVIYTEIPSVDRVYGLIMDIYMMRECGEFELEEKLFAKLLFLYRSPEMLIEWSRREDELRFDQLPPPASVSGAASTLGGSQRD